MHLSQSSIRRALVSPPWPLYTRPSIQLGALKAFVRSRFPAVEVAAHPLYLRVAEAIGYRVYHAVSGAHLDRRGGRRRPALPERRERAARLFRREAAGAAALKGVDFDALAAQLQRAMDAWIASVAWEGVRLVGFSSVLCQLTACLYLIGRLKQAHPHLTTVIGGPALSAHSAGAALELFPHLDAVVVGEGELPLAHLVQHHVVDGLGLPAIPPAAGIFTRTHRSPAAAEGRLYQMESLDRLPVPDYDDYFALLSSFAPDSRFFPTLPVEFSRGCWWKRSAGSASGCRFCNLNLQWRGYRAKSAKRAVAEVEHLTRRHRVLSVAVVDNVLPRTETAEILRGLAGLGRDLSLFAELRATTPADELACMPAAGLRRVQVGIEALSTRLLRKLHKGTTAIQNLEIMKRCEQLGIVNLANLILDFPSSDDEDVRETLRAIEFARAYRPPKPVAFWLGLGSPVWSDPEGLRPVPRRQPPQLGAPLPGRDRSPPAPGGPVRSRRRPPEGPVAAGAPRRWPRGRAATTNCSAGPSSSRSYPAATAGSF
ncbi:MAG: RiPP maturation radical SAM C-methyltransferase [Desulfobacterales bacterium]|nr:RiPP maturation radical SAM C-methyltransferase [Desulfobacterales bacterium]